MSCQILIELARVSISCMLIEFVPMTLLYHVTWLKTGEEKATLIDNLWLVLSDSSNQLVYKLQLVVTNLNFTKSNQSSWKKVWQSIQITYAGLLQK